MLRCVGRHRTMKKKIEKKKICWSTGYKHAGHLLEWCFILHLLRLEEDRMAPPEEGEENSLVC